MMTHRICRIVLFAVMGMALAMPAAAAGDEALKAAIASDARTSAQKARDPYRHPYETLRFFGIRPDMTVVELWPFGGWYTSILAPYLRDEGQLVVANLDPESAPENELSFNIQLQKMMTSRPDVFGKVKTVPLSLTKPLVPDGTADMVLTFRNIHNWNWEGQAKTVFQQAYRALKPGGILGVVEHSAADPAFEPKHFPDGYVGRSWAIELIESVGFKLANASDINANPKDTKDYPRGVWTLPPDLAMGDQDREKYLAIGESDRFTLKFVKPE
jgi:predicted methyltransferase